MFEQNVRQVIEAHKKSCGDGWNRIQWVEKEIDFALKTNNVSNIKLLISLVDCYTIFYLNKKN